MGLLKNGLWVLQTIIIGVLWIPIAGSSGAVPAEASVCCKADFDHDGDVDGIDLKTYASSHVGVDPSFIAPEFGCSACWIPVDYSGTYYTAIGPDPLFLMTITQSAQDVTFTFKGKKMEFAGTGIATCSDIALNCVIEGMGELEMGLTFGDDGQSFSGIWGFLNGSADGTVTGSKTPWPVYDLEGLGIPYFLEADCIELDKIRRITKLRSGEGHDYSDDFEACRSMKHYYYPKVEGDTSVRVYSPVSGTVIGGTREYYESGGSHIYKGTLVGIVPDGYEAFWIDLFHINLHRPLEVGERVTAGQELGTTGKTSGTVLDVAVWVHTPVGAGLISFFEVMFDSVFQIYQARGMTSREEAIITQEQRDADPLTCDGDQFQGPGSLENHVCFDGICF